MAERRRHMFIDPPEQVVFAARSTVHVVIFLLAASILIYGPGEQGVHLSDVQRTTNEFLYAISGRLWLMLPALGVVWLVSVIGSHRVVGPVFGFKNALKAVKEGNLTVQLAPRKGDHFGELAQLINETNEQHRRALLEMRQQVAWAEAALGRDGTPESAKLTEARQALKGLSETLAKYSL